MSLRRFFTALSVVGLLSGSGAAAADDEMPFFAVPDASYNANLSSWKTEYLTSMEPARRLKEALLATGGLRLLERESGKLQSGQTTEQQIALHADEDQTQYNLTTADFVVALEVEDFVSSRSYKKIPNLDAVYEGSEFAKFRINVRVNNRQRETVYQETLTRRVDRNLGAKASSSKPKGGAARRSSVDKLLNQIMGEVTSHISNKILPITVLEVDGMNVVLDRGRGAGFKVGQKLRLYSQSKTVTHPTTGKEKRIPGRSMGYVEVVQSDSDVTWATSLEGTTAQAGYTVRFDN